MHSAGVPFCSRYHDRRGMALQHGGGIQIICEIIYSGDHPQNWRATIPKTGGRPSHAGARQCDVYAGERGAQRARRARRASTFRATIPRTGGRPSQELADGHHTLERGSVTSLRASCQMHSEGRCPNRHLMLVQLGFASIQNSHPSRTMPAPSGTNVKQRSLLAVKNICMRTT